MLERETVVPWLWFGGLVVSAWVLGEGFGSLCTDHGAGHCESAAGVWGRTFWISGIVVAPVMLGALWVWSPLERSGTVAADPVLRRRRVLCDVRGATWLVL